MVNMFCTCFVIWRILRALLLPGGAPQVPPLPQVMVSALASSSWEDAGVLRDCLREPLGLGSDSLSSLPIFPSPGF